MEIEHVKALVASAKAGGKGARDAFAELVELHQARLVRLMRQLLGSEGDDVAQEAFVRAYLAIERAPDDGHFWPWLRTIGTRLAYNHRRDRKTRKRYEDRVEISCGAKNVMPERESIYRVFDKLSYPYREILVLRYVEELSIAEIAKSLRLGSSAAKMRLSRAREEFREVHEKLTR